MCRVGVFHECCCDTKTYTMAPISTSICNFGHWPILGAEWSRWPDQTDVHIVLRSKCFVFSWIICYYFAHDQNGFSSKTTTKTHKKRPYVPDLWKIELKQNGFENEQNNYQLNWSKQIYKYNKTWNINDTYIAPLTSHQCLVPPRQFGWSIVVNYRHHFHFLFGEGVNKKHEKEVNMMSIVDNNRPPDVSWRQQSLMGNKRTIPSQSQ